MNVCVCAVFSPVDIGGCCEAQACGSCGPYDLAAMCLSVRQSVVRRGHSEAEALLPRMPVLVVNV